MYVFLLHSLLIAITSCNPIPNGNLDCQEMSIPISVTAQNRDLPLTLMLDDLLRTPDAPEKILASAGTVVSGGDFNIAARYCKPLNENYARGQTLQILVHGITYTRDYWSGVSPPGTRQGQDEYSWVLYAATQGYHTLSVDRLCNGESSKPNGISVCQLPLESEAMFAIIQAARSGSLPNISTKFDKIVFVGHSYGSLIANVLTVQRPEAVDAYVMSGFTTKLYNGGASSLTSAKFLPAAVARPTENSNLLLDPAYLVATSLEGITVLFYHGDYDSNMVQADFDHRGTVTLGELATAILGQAQAPDYKGKLLVLNGENDALFCQPDAVEGVAGVPGECSQEVATAIQQSYPAVSVFKYHNTPVTGHVLDYHHSTQDSFMVAHNFLADVGF